MYFQVLLFYLCKMIRGGGTDFGLGGQKLFYRGQKNFFAQIFFPQERLPSNIGWAAAHPAHPGPTPLLILNSLHNEKQT